jgi:hypothetical protein
VRKETVHDDVRAQTVIITLGCAVYLTYGKALGVSIWEGYALSKKKVVSGKTSTSSPLLMLVLCS